MKASRALTHVAWLLPLAVGTAVGSADPPQERASAPEGREAAVARLQPFQALIGGWRGAAQPVRNSTKGAWIEKAAWSWDVRKETAEIVAQVDGGRLVRTLRVHFDPAARQYRVRLERPDETVQEYLGTWRDRQFVAESAPHAGGLVHRLTLTLLNEKRTLLLLETRTAQSQMLTRVVEVGYTRQGTRLAEEGVTGPECIVTGGLGEIRVEHKGQTYWVCCTGCRDAFLADPEGILAEAQARAAKKRAAAQKP